MCDTGIYALILFFNFLYVFEFILFVVCIMFVHDSFTKGQPQNIGQYLVLAGFLSLLTDLLYS